MYNNTMLGSYNQEIKADLFVEGCIFLTSAVAQQQKIQKYWDQGTSEKFDLLQKNLLQKMNENEQTIFIISKQKSSEGREIKYKIRISK